MSIFRDPVDRRARFFWWLMIGVLELGLLVGLVFDLSQLDGKGWIPRTIFFNAIVFALPGFWRLSKRRFAFSYIAGGLLAAPFAVDIWGNVFGLYDSVDGFDNYLHFLNWTFLTAFFTVTVLRSSPALSGTTIVSLGAGFGSTMIILWEFMEYLVMKMGTEALHLTYEDTISDLMLSMSGGFVGALAATLLLRSGSR
jgi:uncharacterized membrane protein